MIYLLLIYIIYVILLRRYFIANYIKKMNKEYDDVPIFEWRNINYVYDRKKR